MTVDTTFHPLSFRTTNISDKPSHVLGSQTVVILNYVSTFLHQEHYMYQTMCPHSINEL